MTQQIAYQGEPGANSDIACRDAYPHLAPLPCASFEDAFAAVTEERAALGDDPDRKFDRRPRRGHPSFPAAFRACISSANIFCRSIFT